MNEVQYTDANGNEYREVDARDKEDRQIVLESVQKMATDAIPGLTKTKKDSYVHGSILSPITNSRAYIVKDTNSGKEEALSVYEDNGKVVDSEHTTFPDKLITKFVAQKFPNDELKVVRPDTSNRPPWAGQQGPPSWVNNTNATKPSGLNMLIAPVVRGEL